MINYRVDDMDALVQRMCELDVIILDTVEAFECVKFLHILDPEVNQIDLSEPND